MYQYRREYANAQYDPATVETKRQLNVGENTASMPPLNRGFGAGAMSMMGTADSWVQSQARGAYNAAAGLMGDRMNGIPRDLIQNFGQAVHAPRTAFADGLEGNIAFGATRAMQAGGLTAAGIGLAKLTQAMGHYFGNEADAPGVETLQM